MTGPWLFPLLMVLAFLVGCATGFILLAWIEGWGGANLSDHVESNDIPVIAIHDDHAYLAREHARAVAEADARAIPRVAVLDAGRYSCGTWADTRQARR